MKSNDNIEKLYDTYSKSLYFTSLRIVGNNFDAQEIMQDTFIKYYNLKDKIGINKPMQWLKSVCIRGSIDKLREKNKEKLFLEEYSKNVLNKEINEDGKVNYSVEKIKQAFNNLPDNYRIILSLLLFEGYDYNEISQFTGLKEVTIRSQYLRGKQKLIKIINNE